MERLQKLGELKRLSQNNKCVGIDSKSVEHFLKNHPDLGLAIDQAYDNYLDLKNQHAKVFAMPDSEQIKYLQEDFINFYDPETVNPYVALAARGPWVVTSNGAVIHDNGGYGMLGFGHNPKILSKELSADQAMTNIMTAQFSQLEFRSAIKGEIGHNRKGGCPYVGFMCLNSGSEAMTLAIRFADINTKNVMDAKPGHFKKTAFVSFKGGFHGRTDRPSRISDSSLLKYQKHLASFQGPSDLITVKPNDIDGLKRIFAEAKKDRVFIEALVFEPVMGEGNPGQAMTPEFYQCARELSEEANTLLIIDSIQAGIRTYGVLSICDYPGFEKLKCPNIESFSKALNAGQYPFSLLALSSQTAKTYQVGLYGNTMTSNPRALNVATKVLKSLSLDLRHNIVKQGKNFVAGFSKIQKQFPDLVDYVQGTGLLFSLGINSQRAKVVGKGGLEQQLRLLGLGVIHGGENALRFTPHFAITDDEVEWVLKVLTQNLQNMQDRRLEAS